MKVYEFNNELFDDEGIATIVAENWREMLTKVFGSNVRAFLDVLPDHIADDIKDWLMDDMSGHANWDMLDVNEREVLGREAGADCTVMVRC